MPACGTGFAESVEGESAMRKLILGAAALTALPLLTSQLICLPALPEPVHLLSKGSGVVLLETVRLF